MRRTNTTIALTLIIVLGIGPVLTLVASEKSPGAGVSHSRSWPARSRLPRAAKPLQMPTLLEGQTATTLPDGRILLIGGIGRRWTKLGYHDSKSSNWEDQESVEHACWSRVAYGDYAA